MPGMSRGKKTSLDRYENTANETTLEPTLLRSVDGRCMHPTSFEPNYDGLRLLDWWQTAAGQLLTRYREFDCVRNENFK